MMAILLTRTLSIFSYLLILFSRQSVSWNVEIIQDTDTTWNASDLIYGPEANHENDSRGADFVGKIQDSPGTSVNSFSTSTEAFRTGRKSDQDFTGIESDHVNKFFQGILKDESIKNDQLAASIKDGIFVLIDGDYDFGNSSSNSTDDSNEAVIVQQNDLGTTPSLPSSTTFPTTTSSTSEQSYQSTQVTTTASPNEHQSRIPTATSNIETSADQATTISSTVSRTGTSSPNMAAETSESSTQVSTTARAATSGVVSSSAPTIFSTETTSTSKVSETATIASAPVSTLSMSKRRTASTSPPSSKATISTTKIITNSVQTATIQTPSTARSTSVPESTKMEIASPTATAEMSATTAQTSTVTHPSISTVSIPSFSAPAHPTTTAAPQTIVIHNHHYHFHFPDEDHEAVIKVADEIPTPPATPEPTLNVTQSPIKMSSTTSKTSVPAPKLSPENQRAWDQTLQALLNQQQKNRRSRMLRSRTSSYGPGIRRRQTVPSYPLRNLSKAKGTGQVVVYKIVRQNGNKVKLVKNMRKKAIQVFPVKSVIGPKAFKRQTSWKVVPQWKIQGLKQAGFNITYGKVGRRRLRTKLTSKPTTPTPPVEATAFEILTPNPRNDRNKFLQASRGRSVSDKFDKLRFMVPSQNSLASKSRVYNLENLDLKLKNRLKL